MTNWVRLWDDMPADPKWRLIALKTERPISEVIAVFNFMLIRASDWEHRGSIDGWNDDVVGAALELDGRHIETIRTAMQGLVLDGNQLKGWEKRQPDRERDRTETSTERVRAFRERKKHGGNGDETENVSETKRNNETHETLPDKSQIRKDKSRLESTRARAREVELNSTPKVKISVPERPNDQAHRDAERFGLNTTEAVEVEYERFRDYNLARGAMLADWDAAWRNWLAKTGEFASKRAVRGANGHATGPPTKGAAATQIYIKAGTKQWIAWEKYYHESLGRKPPKHFAKDPDGGWWFPTEWPGASA
jgi:hypothetical protein